MIDMDKLMEQHDRRKKVNAMKPTCSECGTNQVQLVSWFTDTVDMKCRHCKHKFQLEVA